MAYLGRTVEKKMYLGASRALILKARELRKNMTESEEVLWSQLRKKQVNGTVFRRQHPMHIYIADFYCHKYQLVIEVDGSIHEIPENAIKDQRRTQDLERFDIKVIRFSNEEVIFNTENVIKIIKSYICD